MALGGSDFASDFDADFDADFASDFEPPALLDDDADELSFFAAPDDFPPPVPTFFEQDGQAPQPCEARTRSATAICCSRLAPDAEPFPPWARQVDGENCRPPE